MANVLVTTRDTQLEKQRAGYIALSLTNMDSTAEPAIASGSVVEVAGSLYEFTGNQAITGTTPSTGAVWIKVVPSGTDPLTAEYTETAPTWDDAKQGWYGESAASDHRYVAGLTKTAAAEFDDKFLMTAVERGVTVSQGPSVFSRSEFITSTGTWNIPNGVYKLKITAVGGGGGGAGTTGNGGAGSETVVTDGTLTLNTGWGSGGNVNNAPGQCLFLSAAGTGDALYQLSGGHGSPGVAGGFSDFVSMGGFSIFGRGGPTGFSAGVDSYGSGGGGSDTTASGSGGGSPATVGVWGVTPGGTLTITIGGGGTRGSGGNAGVGMPGVVLIEY